MILPVITAPSIRLDIKEDVLDGLQDTTSENEHEKYSYIHVESGVIPHIQSTKGKSKFSFRIDLPSLLFTTILPKSCQIN